VSWANPVKNRIVILSKAKMGKYILDESRPRAEDGGAR
jgi:hypothetical protein